MFAFVFLCTYDQDDNLEKPIYAAVSLVYLLLYGDKRCRFIISLACYIGGGANKTVFVEENFEKQQQQKYRLKKVLC